MARKRKADMTLAQRNAADNDQFRAELRAELLEDAQPAPRNDDIAKFRRDSYRDALRDAKANN